MRYIKILSLALLMFFINGYVVNATDFKCAYKNGNQTLDLNVGVTGDMDYPISYSLSINGAMFIKFHPANFILFSNNEYERYGGDYYIKGDYWKAACPKSLHVVWKNNNFLYQNVKFDYNMTYVKMPIIFFSETGYEIIDNKMDTFSELELEDWEDHVKGLLNKNDSEYKDNIKQFDLNIDDSSDIGVTPPPEAPDKEPQYCYYENSCGAVIELKFYRNGKKYQRIFNDGKKLMNWENEDSCPTSVKVSDSNYYGQSISCASSGSVIDCYNYSTSSNTQNSSLITDGTCKDVSDNSNEVAIRYVSYRNSASTYIKMVEKNGKLEASLVTGSSTKTLTKFNIGMYESTFLSGNTKKFPKYLNCTEDIEKLTSTSGASCSFSNKLDGTAKRKYIYVNAIYEMGQLGKDIYVDTCKDLLGSDFIGFLKKNVFNIIYIAVPIILILLTSFDFAKVVFVDDKSGIQSSFKRFGKRCIAAILIYLIPTILIFVTNIFQADEVASCAKEFKKIAESNQ